MQQYAKLVRSRQETDRRRMLITAASAAVTGIGARPRDPARRDVRRRVRRPRGRSHRVDRPDGVEQDRRPGAEGARSDRAGRRRRLSRCASRRSSSARSPRSTRRCTALCDRQGQLSREVTTLIERLQEIPERVFEAMKEVDGGRVATEEAVEETACASREHQHARSAASTARSRASRARPRRPAPRSSRCRAPIDEVARSAASLNDVGRPRARPRSTRSAPASGRSRRAPTAVQSMAEESAAAMVQMDRAIQEVGEHVREAVRPDRAGEPRRRGRLSRPSPRRSKASKRSARRRAAPRPCSSGSPSGSARSARS